ncbi:hypothetical protein [Ruegeria atlantica]|uniref:hypothetical protein n=1 Tax=Ruegeria atlantica TaxID=81569 RepID=UPI00071D0322|nr:hypothetical protein [Ruegeria atlantica]
MFDIDGPLWVEKPLYTHAYAIYSELKRQIEADQTSLIRATWKSVTNKDFGYFEQLYTTSEYKTLASQMFAAPFGGITSDDYAEWARDFADSFKLHQAS